MNVLRTCPECSGGQWFLCVDHAPDISPKMLIHAGRFGRYLYQGVADGGQEVETQVLSPNTYSSFLTGKRWGGGLWKDNSTENMEDNSTENMEVHEISC